MPISLLSDCESFLEDFQESLFPASLSSHEDRKQGEKLWIRQASFWTHPERQPTIRCWWQLFKHSRVGGRSG